VVKIGFLTFLIIFRTERTVLILLGLILFMTIKGRCCVTGCDAAHCDSFDNCWACISGYYFLSNGTCIDCPSKIANCISCSSNTICLSCVSPYILNSSPSSCVLCSTAIFSCINCVNSTYCLSCSSNLYYLDDSGGIGTLICTQCSTLMPFSCINCVNSTYCLSCSSNLYYLDDSGGIGTLICTLCSTLMPDCQLCASATNCTSCISSKYYLNLIGIGHVNCTLCSASMAGCATCSNNMYCLFCVKGYHLNVNEANAVCILCSSVMFACSDCADLTTCLSCDLSYYLNISGSGSANCKLCWKGVVNCLYCENVTSSSNFNVLSCTFCAANYVSVPNS